MSNNRNNTRKFKLHWLTGETEIVESDSQGSRLEAVKDAVTKAGIGGGAFNALDYWEEIEPDQYLQIKGKNISREILERFADYCQKTIGVLLTPEGIKYLIEKHDIWQIIEGDDFDTGGRELIANAIAKEICNRDQWPCNMDIMEEPENTAKFYKDYKKSVEKWTEENPEFVKEGIEEALVNR